MMQASGNSSQVTQVRKDHTWKPSPANYLHPLFPAQMFGIVLDEIQNNERKAEPWFLGSETFEYSW